MNNTSVKMIRASNAASRVSCKRRVWLQMHQPAEYEADPFIQLLTDTRLRHERSILRQLQRNHTVFRAASFDETQALMRQGVPVIYQAQLQDVEKSLAGYPDFLNRSDRGVVPGSRCKINAARKQESAANTAGSISPIAEQSITGHSVSR